MRSYIVIVSPSCGGAEKRFFDIFTSMRRRGEDVGLIAPSSLVDQLKADHVDRDDVSDALVPITMRQWSRLEFVCRFRKLLQALPRGGSYHYPLNCLWPLHLGRGDRVSMSVADCTSIPGPFAIKRTSVWAWISFFFVAKIDVLSPSVFSAMTEYCMFKRMSLTPGGTFIVPPPHADTRKLPIVAFLGRLVPGKGIDHFLDILPDLWMQLRGRVPQGLEFQIAGYGQLEDHVANRVSILAQSGIPIAFIGYAAAQPMLARSAVLLSMQEVTNYPSRVVAEALLTGCGVIVRDTGDSRQFGDDLHGLIYCNDRLEVQEIALQLRVLLDQLLTEPKFSKLIRETALERFNSQNYVDYFLDLIFIRKNDYSFLKTPVTGTNGNKFK